MSNLKPIHKFNNAAGATLCHECRTIISNGFTDDILCPKCTDDNLFNEKYFPDGEPQKKIKYKYKLVREGDGLTKFGNNVIWIKFGEAVCFESKHEEPMVNTSLILDFFGPTFTWMTTTINEILESREDYIKFKTKNSIYELFINL
jgi:hypothetical protein